MAKILKSRARSPLAENSLKMGYGKPGDDFSYIKLSGSEALRALADKLENEGNQP